MEASLIIPLCLGVIFLYIGAAAWLHQETLACADRWKEQLGTYNSGAVDFARKCYSFSWEEETE